MKGFKVTDVTHHRNGIGGRPFWSVRFSFDNEGRFHPNMVAIIPSDEAARGECFVLDLNDPTSNWRGDHFEKDVKHAVAERK